MILASAEDSFDTPLGNQRTIRATDAEPGPTAGTQPTDAPSKMQFAGAQNRRRAPAHDTADARVSERRPSG